MVAEPSCEFMGAFGSSGSSSSPFSFTGVPGGGGVCSPGVFGAPEVPGAGLGVDGVYGPDGGWYVGGPSARSSPPSEQAGTREKATSASAVRASARVEIVVVGAVMVSYGI